MHKSKLKRVSIAVCMALMPISLFAAGLGKLNVSSGLGEPLRADIELISITPDELSSLSATIANDEAYATQGIERPSMHNNIQIELAKNASGTPVLKLRTNQPVNDPFIDMLIQVDWASGRLLREYTLLLDPPGYRSQTDKSNLSQPIQAPVTKSSSNINSQPMAVESSNGQTIRPANDSSMTEAAATYSTKAKKTTKRAKIKSELQPDKMAADNKTEQDAYVTKRGDTLSTVAKQMQVDGVSLDQMLVGLYEANPKAFTGNNMNRLRSGQIIRAPSTEILTALSKQQAHAEVKLQSENWNAYRNKLAGMVAGSTPTSEDTSKESTSGKVTTAAEDKASAVKTGPKDVVKLSSGDVKSTANSSAATKAADAKIAMQEDAIAKEKALKDEQDRASALAKIQQTKDLLALKSKQMAELQKQAKDNAAASSKLAILEPSKAVPVAVQPEPAKTEMAKVEPTTPAATQPVPPVITPAPATEKTVIIETPKPKVDKPKPVPVLVPAAKQEPASFLDEILSGIDVTMLAIGGGALALLAAGWLFLRNKRKRNLANFEQGILTSGGLKANTVFGNTTGGKVDTGDTSFLTDFSQSSSGSMIDTHDVDPIAEAEVYMAYGREAQAEEILKDAIVKEPKRYELHLKLLEMYAGRQDTAAYETIAGELYTTLGAGDPIWAKVAEMGKTIEPDNPLYQGASFVVAPSVSMAKLQADDFSDITEIKPEATDTQPIDFSMSDVNSEFEDISSLSNKSLLTGSEVEEPSGFDFDLGTLSSDSVTNELKSDNLDASFIGTASTITNAPVVDESMDFNLADFGTFSEAIEAETQIIDEDKFSHTLSTFAVPDTEPTKVDVEPQVTDINFDLPSFELNHANTNNLTAEEIDFNFTAPENDEDFLDETSLDIGAVDKVDAKLLDFSGLSLDLGEPETSNQSSASTSNESPIMDLPTIQVSSMLEDASSVNDSADVETKLDLVSAYLEMDDKEGAKELIEEVLKEGSIRQIAKAKELLAHIV